MLVRQPGPIKTSHESKELGGRKSKAGLGGVERDVVFQAYFKKVFKVPKELVEIIRIPKPIINVVANLLQPLGGIKIRALRFSARILLSKR